MEIQDIMKLLAKNKVSTSIHYDTDKEQCYVNLETMAKSHLHLYEDGMLYGRYQYEKQMDLSRGEEDLLIELCHEFDNALHGRGYCQEAWLYLCREKGIDVEIYC